MDDVNLPMSLGTDVILPELIETQRLILHRWRVDDAPYLSAAIAASIDHLRPWMSWIAFEPATPNERMRLIDEWEHEWEKGGDVIYGVRLDGEVIGGTGLHRRNGPGTLDIGYWIHADHLRQGFATEVTAGLTDAAFAIDGVDVVHVQTDEANTASAAVPDKLGFSPTAHLTREPRAPGETGRLIDWTMTRNAWKTTPAR